MGWLDDLVHARDSEVRENERRRKEEERWRLERFRSVDRMVKRLLTEFARAYQKHRLKKGWGLHSYPRYSKWELEAQGWIRYDSAFTVTLEGPSSESCWFVVGTSSAQLKTKNISEDEFKRVLREAFNHLPHSK